MIASKQIAENYVETGRKKAELPVSHMLILGFFAGMFIALAGAGASVASAAMTKCLGIAIASHLYSRQDWRWWSAPGRNFSLGTA